MCVPVVSLCKIDDSDFGVLFIKKRLLVDHTYCITHDKTNSLCLSDSCVPLPGSKCVLYFLHSREYRNEYLF